MVCLHIEALRGDGLGPIDLRIEAGECVCLSGPSGAGKTRLLRAIADLDPHAGTVSLDGVDATRMAAPAWRRAVALLPADSRWWGARVAEHFPRDAQPDPAQVGLPQDALQWNVERLSSGERQRLALLRVLANQPKVLLLDEPTANLDAANAERIEALIAEYKTAHAAAVIWVSHDAQQIVRVADRRLLIDHGRLVERIGAAA